MGNLRLAWGGIASLQLSLSIVCSVLTGAGWSPSAPLLLAEAMSYRPARLVGLQDRKGAIAPGRDADLVVFDPHVYTTVSPEGLHQRHPITPYEGHSLRGRVEKTILRGKTVYEHGQFREGPGGEGAAARTRTWRAVK